MPNLLRDNKRSIYAYPGGGGKTYVFASLKSIWSDCLAVG